MPRPAHAEQRRDERKLLIEQLGRDLGNAVVQLANEAAYGRSRLTWHRKLFVEGMKESAFQNLPPETIAEIEADSWASMIMCVARLTDGDDRRSGTVQMLPRLIREDDELQPRLASRAAAPSRRCAAAPRRWPTGAAARAWSAYRRPPWPRRPAPPPHGPCEGVPASGRAGESSARPWPDDAAVVGEVKWLERTFA